MTRPHRESNKSLAIIDFFLYKNPDSRQPLLLNAIHGSEECVVWFKVPLPCIRQTDYPGR